MKKILYRRRKRVYYNDVSESTRMNIFFFSICICKMKSVYILLLCRHPIASSSTIDQLYTNPNSLSSYSALEK